MGGTWSPGVSSEGLIAADQTLPDRIKGDERILIDRLISTRISTVASGDTSKCRVGKEFDRSWRGEDQDHD